MSTRFGSGVSAPSGTRVDFRVGDFVTPGAAVELKVSAADGIAAGKMVEEAIAQVEFRDPQCDVHDPAPDAVDDLIVDHDGTGVTRGGSRPALDSAHGESASYRTYRSESPWGGFIEIDPIVDDAATLQVDDTGAVASPFLLFYEVIATHGARTPTRSADVAQWTETVRRPDCIEPAPRIFCK